MNKYVHDKLPFGCEFAISDVTFDVESTAKMSERVLDEVSNTFNRYGFVILECAQRPEPKENLLALAPLFGRVVPHNRSDRHGVLSVNAHKPVPGFIDSSHEAHPPHTDGSFKDNPERVLALQCIVPAEIGGGSVLGSGKLAHDVLAKSCPGDLLQLYAMDAMSIRRNEQSSTKPVFKWEDKRVGMCFRLDEIAQTRIKPAAQAGFTKLKQTLDNNLLRFDLKPHQILIIDNLSMVHGREAFPAGSNRQYLRLNFSGDGLLDLNYGFRPAAAEHTFEKKVRSLTQGKSRTSRHEHSSILAR